MSCDMCICIYELVRICSCASQSGITRGGQQQKAVIGPLGCPLPAALLSSPILCSLQEYSIAQLRESGVSQSVSSRWSSCYSDISVFCSRIVALVHHGSEVRYVSFFSWPRWACARCQMLTNCEAIISVYDKTGLLDLAKGLHNNNVRLLASGGTAKLIREAGFPVE